MNNLYCFIIVCSNFATQKYSFFLVFDVLIRMEFDVLCFFALIKMKFSKLTVNKVEKYLCLNGYGAESSLFSSIPSCLYNRGITFCLFSKIFL